ncbi:DUF5643 domain-containing protein [Peribacillus muralis]|uniref:DUF5643 domain-containing protein n=1 Tax=Peribacillus muralis TaxID=264697 RepID=UPI003CFE9A9E
MEVTTKNNKNKAIKVISVNHEQEVGGVQIQVPDLALSAEGLALYVKSSEKGKRDSANYLNAGNIEFRITDDQGKEITSHSGEVTGTRHLDKWIYSSEKTFSPIPKGVKELTITPYTMLPNHGGGTELDKQGNEEDIQFDYSTLKNVKFNSFTVKIPHEKNNVFE